MTTCNGQLANFILHYYTQAIQPWAVIVRNRRTVPTCGRAGETNQSAVTLICLAKRQDQPEAITEKMDALETEITVLEDKLGKSQARRKATEMTANSNKYLHANLQLLP